MKYSVTEIIGINDHEVTVDKFEVDGTVDSISSNSFVLLDDNSKINVDCQVRYSLNNGDRVSIVATKMKNHLQLHSLRPLSEEVIQKSIKEFTDVNRDEKLLDLTTTINTVKSNYLPDHGFQLLINEDLSNKILYFGEVDKKRFHKALQDLQLGYWNLGVKVKKLVGIKTPVFEARLDRDRRILFVIKSIPVMDQNMVSPTLVIEDIVRHKKITSGANKISKLQVERLNYQNYNLYLIGEVEKEEEIKTLDELDLNKFSLMDEIMMTREINNQDDTRDDTGLPNGIKYYRFDKEIREFWISTGDIKQFLALSPFQSHIIYQHGPVLINGGAGTGKTTVLAHIYAFFRKQKNESMLYVTLTKPLREFISEIIQNMGEFSEKDLRGIITFNDVCKGIIKADQEDFPERKQIDIFDFTNWISNYPDYQVFDTLQLWQEYYGIIKGTATKYEPGIITLKEYLEAGRDNSLFQPEMRQQIYNIIRKYHLERREEKLWDTLDLAQFTYEKIKNADSSKEIGVLHGIICDEIQDFVHVQYALFNLLLDAKYNRNLFFGGDSQQTINSSNFRWEEMKTQLFQHFGYENERKGLSDVIHMTRNFRSTSKLIELANAFLLLKEKIGIKDNSDKLQKGIETDDIQHFPGVLLEEDSSFEDILPILKKDSARIVIVYNEKSKEVLEEHIDTAFLLSVAEAKGLEFPGIFVFNLASDSGLDWRKMFTDSVKYEYIQENQLLIKYVFNRIYVAITRARRNIVIYEEDKQAHNLWKKLLSESFKTGSVEMLEKIWIAPTSKEEYIRHAIHFFRQERFLIAADYFKRGGDLTKHYESIAFDHRAKRQYEKSSENFVKIGDYKNAAREFEEFDVPKAEALYEKLQDDTGRQRCVAKRLLLNGDKNGAAKKFENIREFRDAELLFISIGKINAGYRCRAKLYEKYREWEEASKYWKKLGEQKNEINALIKHHESVAEFEEAATLAEKYLLWGIANGFYQQAGLDMKAKYCEAKNFENEKSYEKADLIFSQINEWEDRIEMWTKLGEYETVARIYEDRIKIDKDEEIYYKKAAEAWGMAGNLEKAIEIIRLIDDLPLIARYYAKAERWSVAAEMAERGNALNQAADYWMKDQNYENAEKIYEKTKSFGQLVEVKVLLNKHEEAAELFEKLKIYKKAAEQWIIVSNHGNSAKNYEKIKEWGNAAIQYKECKMYENSAEMYEKMEAWGLAGEDWLLANKVGNAAEAYDKAKLYSKSAPLFAEVGEYLKSAVAWGQAANISGVTETFPLFESAGDMYSKAEKLEDAIRMYKRARKWAKCAISHELLREYKDAAENWEEAKDLEKAAKCWTKIKQWTHAAENYENVELWEEALKCRKKERPVKHDKIAICSEMLGDYRTAANYWGKLKKYEKAGNAWEKCEEFELAIKNYKKGNSNNFLARVYEKTENYEMAAHHNNILRKYDIAAPQYEKAGLLEKAAENYDLSKNFEKAVELWEKTENWKKLGNSLLKINKTEKALVVFEKGSNWTEMGEIYFDRKEYDNALLYYMKNENWDKVGECHYRLEHWKKALDAYLNTSKHDLIAKCYKKLKEWENALEYYIMTDNTKNIISMYEKLGRWDEIILLHVEKKEWDIVEEKSHTFVGKALFSTLYDSVKKIKNRSVFIKFALKFPTYSIFQLLVDEEWELLYNSSATREHPYLLKFAEKELEPLYQKIANEKSKQIKLEQIAIRKKNQGRKAIKKGGKYSNRNRGNKKKRKRR